MTETVIIGNEEEARIATERQMAETARRWTRYDNGSDFPPDQVATIMSPPIGNGFPLVHQQPYITQQTGMPQVLAPAEHLILTPSERPGRVRLVRMQGANKLGSWTVEAVAATTVASILQAFGITLTDLRESEEEQ